MKFSVLYMREKEPCIYPQKRPLYICSRSIYISTKETCMYPRKLIDIDAYAREIDRALKRKRKRVSYRDRLTEPETETKIGGWGGRERESSKPMTSPTQFPWLWPPVHNRVGRLQCKKRLLCVCVWFLVIQQDSRKSARTCDSNCASAKESKTQSYRQMTRDRRKKMEGGVRDYVSK